MSDTIPQRLFRYTRYSDFLLNSLRSNTVWYSRPHAFNDVFDCRFQLVNSSRTQNASMLPKLLEALPVERIKLVPGADGKPARIEEVRIDLPSLIGAEHFQATAIEQLTPLLVDRFNSAVWNIGVHCLSETEDSLLMWSHYSDHHKGLCLTVSLKPTFLAQHGFFANKVRYTNYYPEVSAIDFLIDPHKVVDTVIFTKSIEWAYENEWRIVTPFTFGLTGSCIQDSLYESPYEVVAITFGSRMEPVQMRAVVEAIESHTSRELHFFIADPSVDKFAICKRPISRSEIYENAR